MADPENVPEILYARALDCSKSPHNVRTQSDPEADAQLEANIGETGIVLQNLIGIRVPRKKGKFEIYGGGRRLDGVHANIASGKLPEGYLVPVLVVASAKEALAMSLEENYYNLRMNPADECRAFQTIIDTQNKSAADLAKRLGVTERFVLGRLRLANLAEPVFEALRAGGITLDVAQAYATTSDTGRQAAVFEQMNDSYYGDKPSEIRRQLASFCYRGGDPKAVLVGRDAYLAAGGRIDPDLFADAETEMWIDAAILDHLVEERMRAAADEIARRDGLGEVRVHIGQHLPWNVTRELDVVLGDTAVLTDEEEARATAIEAEIEETEARFEQEDVGEEDEQRLASLEAELASFRGRPPVVSDEDRAGAIAYMVLGADGVARLGANLYRAPAPEPDDEGSEGEANEGACAGESTAEGASTKSHQSQKLKLELAMMKTELLATHVAAAPGFAINLATFLMADAVACHSYALPTELRSIAPHKLLPDFASGSAAETQWQVVKDGLDRSWVEAGSMEARYDAFCALDEDARAAWFAYLVARTLKSVPAGDPGSAFLDHLGRQLAIDEAAWWRPTARNYFDRLRKDQILDLFDAIGGTDLKVRYVGSKKHDLAASAEKLFAGDVIVEAEIKDRALRWVPDALRFSPTPVVDEVAAGDDGDAPIEPFAAEDVETVPAGAGDAGSENGEVDLAA